MEDAVIGVQYLELSVRDCAKMLCSQLLCFQGNQEIGYK